MIAIKNKLRLIFKPSAMYNNFCQYVFSEYKKNRIYHIKLSVGKAWCTNLSHKQAKFGLVTYWYIIANANLIFNWEYLN